MKSKFYVILVELLASDWISGVVMAGKINLKKIAEDSNKPFKNTGKR